ncbi:imelysin family protein [Agaribacter marinus]|uniref:Insulin-cleaving metalloproteinase outer membrane protein n=1 Tax=Agaribacter marinus TaxID=1431249 RepID=A0AA37SY80_9ALTE|nr:imelysin family protein [Agaribacter marinus]GLR69926.1 insulin-cleaving metalloproteinase outer membrane protein [Agaribacter marinus]
MNTKSIFLLSSIVVAVSGCSGDDGSNGAAGTPGAIGADGAPGQDGVSVFVTRDDVIKTNANIAYAAYADSLISASQLKASLEKLASNPTTSTFDNAKQAWLAAREPYGQTEVYRFRAGPIDALNDDGTLGEDGDGPEGRINAWPLGEALIDYVAAVVDGDAGPESPANAINGNIIANTTDFPTIDKAAIEGAFEFGEDERNVTSGYHAIEFLLWGQDLNEDQSGVGTRDTSGGQRPLSDFYTASNGNANACTSGPVGTTDDICQRRIDYLLASADVLIDDLTRVVQAWEPGAGVHYQAFIGGGDVSLSKILEGMGRLSYGELAGERINIALTTDSQEDEHSCFSDNTHRDIFLNAKGVQNSFMATYTRIDGEVIDGASIYDLLVVEGDPELANVLRAALETTMSAAAVIDTKAKTGTPFDVLVQEGVQQANILAVIQGLVNQTDVIEQAIEALSITTDDLRQDTEEDISG